MRKMKQSKLRIFVVLMVVLVVSLTLSLGAKIATNIPDSTQTEVQQSKHVYLNTPTGWVKLKDVKKVMFGSDGTLTIHLKRGKIYAHSVNVLYLQDITMDEIWEDIETD